MRTLLITVDAFRKDHIGYYGYDRNTTPFLDKLAKENTVFKNCYSASCHTREAIPSILTGKKPENCLKGHYRLNAPTIPEKLPDEINTTGITTGCYLTKTERLHKGFDNFKSDYSLGGNIITRQIEYAAHVLLEKQHNPAENQKEDIIQSLESEESFVWTHLMDVHAPYNKYEETHFGEDISRRRLQYLFRKANHTPSLMKEEERNQLIDAYDNSLRHLDSKLKEIIAEIPDDTQVIIVGDHGELLGERGEYEHPRKLVEELIEVPLIIKDGKKKEVERKVSTINIAPTVTEKYGVELSGEGQNLYSRRESNIEISCRKNWKRLHKTI
jgi:arylsulfatase